MSQAGKFRKSSSNQASSNFSSEAGFTLIELVVVMAIMALVASVVFTGSRPGKSGAELKTTVAQIVWRLRNLRSFAINQQRQTVLIVDLQNRFIRDGSGRKPLRLPSDIGVKLTASASEVRSRKISGIRFFPNGSSTGGALRLRQNRQTYEVRVNWLTGRVHVLHNS